MKVDLLQEIIRRKSQKNGNPWVKYSVLAKICKAEHGIDLDGNSFLDNPIFRVYKHSPEWYIALAESFPHTNAAPISALEANLPINQISLLGQYKIDKNKTAPDFQEIKTAEEFKEALSSIITKIFKESRQNVIQLGQITERFSKVYKQPLRPLIRLHFPGKKLLDIIKEIDFITIEEISSERLIRLKKKGS